MSQIVQARCPHCQSVLRIPAEWLDRAMRCKHCREVFQARSRTAEAVVPAAAVAARSSPSQAVTAANAKPAPPAAVAAAPVTAPRHSTRNGDPFAFDDEEAEPAIVPSRSRRQGGGGWLKTGVLLVCVAALVGAAVFFAGPHLSALFRGHKDSKTLSADKGNNKNEEGGHAAEKDPGKSGVPSRPRNGGPKKGNPANIIPGAFPRRALLINVNNYLYLNPLHYGSPRKAGYPGSSSAALADVMSRPPLNIPANQIVELSDGSKTPHPTIKSVIETTISDFLDTSRDQDRIIILFSGHAVDIDKEAYLVPLDGDADNAKTLIPLQWLYDRLAKCPAWQKLLILDVCRYAPARGLEMPVPVSADAQAPGAMGAVLDAKLHNPPPGVQVWSSCIKDQKAYEFEAGSVFLQSLCTALGPTGGVKERLGGIQKEDAALPVETLYTRVKERMKELLDPEKLEQTPRLAGKGPGGTGPYDPKEPFPDPLVIRPPKSLAGNFAGEAFVKNILAEIRRIPGVRAMRPGAENLLNITYLPPFPKSLEAYKADSPTFSELDRMKEADLDKMEEKYPLRVAVVHAIRILNENAKFVMKESLTSPGGPVDGKIKKAFLKDQKAPGLAILDLEGALARLKAVGAERDKEFNKRWLAHYDYTMARLQGRLVYTWEYDYALASVRTDRLPELNPAIHNGWRVAAAQKVSSTKEPKVKTYVKNIGKLWKKVMKDYPGTPWAVMARRESITALGLEWKASRD